MSLGSILLLAALGLAITYGLLGVINMAEKLRGLQVGLVNISSDGGLPWTVLVNAGFL